ncbi:MAG: MFS transporter, partial [Candidatus Spechtbacterales bacterium]
MIIRFSFIYLTVFVNVMAFTLIFPLLPTYAQRFDASTLQIGMLAGSFGLAQLFCSPLWGRVSDRIGRKPTIMMGVSGLGLGFLVLAVSQSLWMLFVGRLLQGVFSGASLPSARAYAADMSDKAGRVKSMGRIEAALAAGIILGPFIGGVLAESSFVIPFINFSVEQNIATPFFFSFLLAIANFLL